MSDDPSTSSSRATRPACVSDADREPLRAKGRTMTRIFGGILPYEAEVAEPNGPRIAAWVLADYADRVDAIFQKWLAEHDAQVAAQAKAEALREAADDINARRNEPQLIALDDRWGGYYAGIRTAMENEEFALRDLADREQGGQP